MSFQNFRLDGGAPSQPYQQGGYPPIPPNGADPQFQLQLDGASRGAARGPYGSGDMDDGYTLVFENLDAFQVWRLKEEEEKVVEFVKGDTHGSKAVPPRFKEHVKLVCARHSRSGRKKYAKKFPERVRKVPSRKLDGKGCSASISYKTYFNTDEIRVCYVSQHSHEIGTANLPYTRRGRRQAGRPEDDQDPSQSGNASLPGGPPPPQFQPMPGSPPMRAHPPQHPAGFASPYPHFPSMSMPAPPGLGVPMPMPVPPPPPPGVPIERLERERWDRMELLWQHIRNSARGFEYPAPSVAALESVLLRMYFESPPQPAPMPMMAPHPHQGPPPPHQNGMPPPHHQPPPPVHQEQPQQPQQPQNNAEDPPSSGSSGEEGDD
ncbi:hypothetical protein OF83DRAFT_1279895 [Amylostereum chailletii]|nr:hypothetical protein OF83DRAFT_1279895 [Amylostereum chailletii]